MLWESGLCDELRVSKWVDSLRRCCSKWRLTLYRLHRLSLLRIRINLGLGLGELELREGILCSWCLERLLFRWFLDWKGGDNLLLLCLLGSRGRKRRILGEKSWVISLWLQERVIIDSANLQERVWCLYGFLYDHLWRFLNSLRSLHDERSLLVRNLLQGFQLFNCWDFLKNRLLLGGKLTFLLCSWANLFDRLLLVSLCSVKRFSPSLWLSRSLVFFYTEFFRNGLKRNFLLHWLLFSCWRHWLRLLRLCLVTMTCIRHRLN